MDNQALVQLIRKAQGTHTQNRFAELCGISASSLTRICQGQQRPTPALLKKISTHAQRPVGYHDLMIAAGYLQDNSKKLVTPEQFSILLRKLRLEKNMTEKELSSRSFVPYQKIAAYENGCLPQSEYDVISLANALGVSVNYLAESLIPAEQLNQTDFISQYLGSLMSKEEAKPMLNALQSIVQTLKEDSSPQHFSWRIQILQCIFEETSNLIKSLQFSIKKSDNNRMNKLKCYEHIDALKSGILATLEASEE